MSWMPWWGSSARIGHASEPDGRDLTWFLVRTLSDLPSLIELIGELVRGQVAEGRVWKLQRHRDDPRAVPHREAQRAHGVARRRQALATGRQHAGQGTGARVPVEEDAGVGRVRHHCRTGRARGDRTVLHDARPAPHAARAPHRRGDPGREAGAGGDLGAVSGGVSGGVGRSSCAAHAERAIRSSLCSDPSQNSRSAAKASRCAMLHFVVRFFAMSLPDLSLLELLIR